MAQAANDNSGRLLRIADLNADFDGQPRMLDLTLAEALGFKKPRDIRLLISRHFQSLERFGTVCRTARQTSSKGGRPAESTYLNKKQALYICTKSDTERATEVTIQMVEVFDAYTSAKPIHVREHERRASTKIDNAISLARSATRLEAVADKLSPATPKNFCAMLLNGEQLLVDVDDFDLRGDRAVVLTQDGKIEVTVADSHLAGNFKFAGERSAHGPQMPTRFGTSRAGVIVIGKVIQAVSLQAPTRDLTKRRTPPSQIPEEHYRGRKTLFRDEILRLIEVGLPNREIAQRTGACYQTVSHWRRWKQDRALIAAE